MTTYSLRHCYRDVGSSFRNWHQTVMVACSELTDMRGNWDSATTTTTLALRVVKQFTVYFVLSSFAVAAASALSSCLSKTLTGYLSGPWQSLTLWRMIWTVIRPQKTLQCLYSWGKRQKRKELIEDFCCTVISAWQYLAIPVWVSICALTQHKEQST